MKLNSVFHKMQTSRGTDLIRAIGCLCNREVIALPTETNYVIACNATDEEAVWELHQLRKIFRLDAPVLHTDSFTKIRRFAKNIPDAFNDLADRFSPGPLTYLLDRKPVISELLATTNEQVAFRVPAHPMTQTLLSKLGFPVAVIGIPAGSLGPVTAQHAYSVLQGEVSYILDGGPSAVGAGSTLIGMGDQEIVLHREGAISARAISEVSGMAVRHIADNWIGELAG